MRKTKIVCTIGPASESEKALKELADAGMNVARLNFSHGDHKEHGMRINRIKEMNKTLAHPVAILLDTKGPEIRTGILEKDIQITEGQAYSFGEEGAQDKDVCTTLSYTGLSDEVAVGDHIFVDDGMLEFEVEKAENKKIVCRALNSGTLGSRKGVNLPGVDIRLPPLSVKDIEDITFGTEQGVDFIAASFVRCKEDIEKINALVKSKNSNAKIIAKIEHSKAVENLDEIISESDGIMIARGDLGLQVPFEEVPLIQAQIYEKCNIAGKPVITATHMLNSMIDCPRPTRAEVSDVAGSILGGTDAVMLSGETAKGKYPVESVKVLDKICRKADASVKPNFDKMQEGKSVYEIVGHAVANAADRMDAKAILTFTATGKTARMLSRYRSHVPVIAFTKDDAIRRNLAIFWGAHSFAIDGAFSTSNEMVESGVDVLIKKEIVKKGDTLVITAGVPVGRAGVTNMAEIRVV